MEFDYKKHSLEKLKTWVIDALTAAEASPQEIYDTIKNVVDEEYHHFKYHTSRCYELLALLNGNYKNHLSCDENDLSEESKGAWTSFWEEHYYPEEAKDNGMKPWGHSDLEYGLANDILTKDRVSNFPGEQYTESEMDAMCEKAASDQEKEKCREYNLRETEYYDKRSQLDAKQDKVVKWQLPVEIDGISGEYYVQFPDDLMEAADIKENDMVEWVDRGDGSYLLRKLTKQINMEEC